MYSETDQICDYDSKTIYKASSQEKLSANGILQAAWVTLRKTAAKAAYEFHAFVASGEIKDPAPKEFWWDSSEHMQDLFKR